MQVFWISALVAVIAWTQVKEEITRELREWLKGKSQSARTLPVRKLAYMLTCEFCFSFWVSLLALIVFRHRVGYDDWRGLLLAQFVTWAIANVYMTGYSIFRIDIRKDQIEIKKEEAKVETIEHIKNGDGHVRRTTDSRNRSTA